MAWNRPQADSQTKDSLRRAGAVRTTVAVRGAIAGGLVVAAVGGVLGWFALRGGDGHPAPGGTKGHGLIREQKPAGAPRATGVNTSGVNAVGLAQPKKPDYKVMRAVTNANGAVTEDVVLPDGTTKKIVKPPRPVFDNAVDQLIAMTISIQPGMEAAPFPTGVSDDDFRRALKKDVIIYNDDPDHIKELKLRVRETRNEILDIMSKTHKGFEEILQEHRADMNFGTKAYQDAAKGLAEVRKNGTEADVRKYVTVMNAALQQVGAKELPYDDERPVSRGRGNNLRKGTNE